MNLKVVMFKVRHVVIMAITRWAERYDYVALREANKVVIRKLSMEE